jgi:hypothetical protein
MTETTGVRLQTTRTSGRANEQAAPLQVQQPNAPKVQYLTLRLAVILLLR